MSGDKEEKILAVDFGEKRIGLAIAIGDLAEPLAIVDSASAVEQIAKICQQENSGEIVLGLPLGQKLSEATGLKIIFWDEALTSEAALSKMVEAGRPQKKRRHLDDVVAALILQEYLDSK
jgi:putative Holliday junction resolvase